MLKCAVGSVTTLLSSGSTSQNFARYFADCTYICVFTKYTDSFLHLHVGLRAVNFNNIIIYMYTCVSRVAALCKVKITIRGLTLWPWKWTFTV